MIDNRHRRASLLNANETGAGIFLVAFTMLLGACTTPTAPPVAAREPASAETSQRSAQSSGIMYRDGSIPIVKLSPQAVVLAGSHRIGSSRATIAVVEFSDYQCPYCRDFHERIYPRLKKEYVETGIVQFVHKDLPLTSMHPQALSAALAASCAGLQKRFWPMHDALYAYHGTLSPELYPKLAHQLGLDEAKFSSCLGDAAREEVVMRDVVEARGLGITGTPSFVIGRIQGDTVTVERLAKGAPSFEMFAQEVEKLLKTADSGAMPGTK